MKNRITILIPILILITTFIVLVSTMMHFDEKRDKMEFNTFFNAKITGKIVFVDFRHKKDAFKVNNNDSVFFFVSSLHYMHDKGNFFSDEAEKGDSVYKEAFSDTLFLFKKNGEMYMYSFAKIEK
jgi:hypothetical protein